MDLKQDSAVKRIVSASLLLLPAYRNGTHWNSKTKKIKILFFIGNIQGWENYPSPVKNAVYYLSMI
jgi:hypothetical protein